MAIFDLPQKRRTKFSRENESMATEIEEEVDINSKEKTSQPKGNITLYEEYKR